MNAMVMLEGKILPNIEEGKLLKKLWIGLLVMAGLLTMAAGVLAADEASPTFYLDYSQLSNNSGLDSDFITIGGDYSVNHLLFGGSYSDAVSFSPESPGLSVNYLMLYAGYNFLESDTNVLGVIGGFGKINSNDSLTELDATSFLVGLRGAFKQDAFSASLTYLYGVKNTVKVNDVDVNDPDISYLELKLGYDITRNFGLYLVYRDDMMDFLASPGDNDGVGIGAQFRF